MSEVAPPQGYIIGQQPVVNKEGQELTPEARSRYECVMCRCLLRNPCQLVMCGDRVCRDCLPKMYVALQVSILSLLYDACTYVWG